MGGKEAGTSPPNELLRALPRRLVQSEKDEEGRVVLLRPRFLRGPLAWWLQPLLRRPHFHIHLDELGTFVWDRCDGQTTVTEIAAAMETHFDEKAESAMERLRLFLGELGRGQMIQLVVPCDEEDSA